MQSIRTAMAWMILFIGLDLDGDGFPQEDDCDDTEADIYPGAPEVIGDGIDQNCDGVDGVASRVLFF